MKQALRRDLKVGAEVILAGTEIDVTEERRLQQGTGVEEAVFLVGEKRYVAPSKTIQEAFIPRLVELISDCPAEHNPNDYGRAGKEIVLSKGSHVTIDRHKEAIVGHPADRRYYTIEFKGEAYWVESEAFERSIKDIG